MVRRFIKTGVGFLAVGLAMGFWLVVQRELMDMYSHPNLVSAHAHAVLIGFVMFLILGVALWLFPRASKEDTRYSPGRAAAYWILFIATASWVRGRSGRGMVRLAAAGVGGGAGRARLGGGPALLLLGHVDPDPPGGQPDTGSEG